MLALVGLAGYEQQFSAQLSGGEQQRVALARAIVIRPRVLLFDEPLSNLDAKLRVQMRQEIRALQRRLAITTIYVTHDQEEAMAVSDRIAVMNQGSVVQEGGAQDLYHRPASDFVAKFIGRVNSIPGAVASSRRRRRRSPRSARRSSRARCRRGSPAVRAVQLMVRPEAVEIVAADAAGALPATVVTSTFLGEKIEIELACQGIALQAVRYNAGPGEVFAEGATVGVRLPAAALTVLPPAEGSAG